MAAPDFIRKVFRLLPGPTRTRIRFLLARVQGFNRYRIRPTTESGIYLLTDVRGEEIYICRGSRAKLYRYGVRQRIEWLAQSYMLDQIANSSELLIDCGANIGELGIWARARGLSYMAVEPEPLEARCNDRNNFGGQPHTNRYALWHESGIRTFYSAAEWGDSSMIQPYESAVKVAVLAQTLDSILGDLRIPDGTILKIEAEGAEPEVLQGASQTLNRIKWVIVEVGHERGVSRESTFMPAHELLQDHGFRLHNANLRHPAMLYHRE